MTHICVINLIIIGSDNGLSPDQHQAIIWTNAGILSIGPLGTNFSEILIEILTFSFKKMCLKVSFAKRRPFCLSLNVLISEKTPHILSSQHAIDSFTIPLHSPNGRQMGLMVELLPHHGLIITYPVKCGKKLIIHFQTSMVQPFKFGNG